MTIQMTGKNFDLTEAIKGHVEMAIQSRFDAYEALIGNVHVVLEANHKAHGENPVARVQLKMELPGPDIFVEKEGGDLYELVNVVAGTARELVDKRREKGEL